MLAFLAMIAAATIQQRDGLAQPGRICAVGAAVIADLSKRDIGPSADEFYIAGSADPQSLLRLCPHIRLPTGYGIATADAERRARSFRATPSVVVINVGLPIFADSDGPFGDRLPHIPAIAGSDSRMARSHVRAAVHAQILVSYTCPGLCGGTVRLRYARDRKGWRREAPIQVISVS